LKWLIAEEDRRAERASHFHAPLGGMTGSVQSPISF
jgi:hypothetical protein